MRGQMLALRSALDEIQIGVVLLAMRKHRTGATFGCIAQ